MPLRKRCRLETGLGVGVSARVKLAFAPSIQTSWDPVIAYISHTRPSLIMAARPVPKLGPLAGRTARSVSSLTTLFSPIGFPDRSAPDQPASGQFEFPSGHRQRGTTEAQAINLIAIPDVRPNEPHRHLKLETVIRQRSDRQHFPGLHIGHAGTVLQHGLPAGRRAYETRWTIDINSSLESRLKPGHEI